VPGSPFPQGHREAARRGLVSESGPLIRISFLCITPKSGPVLHQNPFQSSLGFELFRARRDAGLTQVALAASAGVSLPTIRQAESGKGSLTAFFRLGTALEMEIGGLTLPPGVTIGTRLAVLRERQGLGRRTVATLAGCSATTLAALEADRDGHLAVATGSPKHLASS
jgi:transcriptional regulator with XRE-family HTH domain